MTWPALSDGAHPFAMNNGKRPLFIYSNIVVGTRDRPSIVTRFRTLLEGALQRGISVVESATEHLACAQLVQASVLTNLEHTQSS